MRRRIARRGGKDYNVAMKIRSIPALLLATVMTCGAAHAEDLPSRTPGLWQSTTTVTGPDGQALANAVNVVTVSCVDALTDEKFLMSGASSCAALTVSGSGGSYAVDGTCAEQAQQVQIHETLLYADTKTVKLTAHITTGAHDLTVHSQLAWQGDCLAGMQPGDEGSVQNGAFSKADNINDPYNQ